MKERIEDRIRTLKWVITSNSKSIPFNEREGGLIDGEINMAEDEIEFLESLLKELENE